MVCLPLGPSRQKWHPLSVMWSPGAATCCCRSINQWPLTNRASVVSESLNGTRRARDAALRRAVLTFHFYPSRSVQLRRSRGRLDPASWLLRGKWESGSSAAQFYDSFRRRLRVGGTERKMEAFLPGNKVHRVWRYLVQAREKLLQFGAVVAH